jgi:ATP-dependent Lhr-like helicase
MVERLREQLTTEKLKDRLDRLLADAEAALAEPLPARPGRRRRPSCRRPPPARRGG